jgi:hypothetical protein
MSGSASPHLPIADGGLGAGEQPEIAIGNELLSFAGGDPYENRTASGS